MFRVEIRADGAHISGYVNVTEKMSRPVVTGKGQKVVELVEPRAFEKAIDRASNVTMTKDHDANIVLAEVRAGTLKLHEDAIGLHAEAVVTDEQTIVEARAGKIKGWSFGMKNISDTIEDRADKLPLRRVSAFDLDHVTLVVNKNPVYAATSVEMRADDTEDTIETRAFGDAPKITENKPKFDNTKYKERVKSLEI